MVTLTGDFAVCLGGARMTWTIKRPGYSWHASSLVGCIEHSRDNFSLDSLSTYFRHLSFQG